MALTGAQVRALRSKAHHLDPIVSVGKADITDALVWGDYSLFQTWPWA